MLKTLKELTKEQLEFYEKNGYLHIPRFISKENIEQISLEIHDLHSSMSTGAIPNNVSITWEALNNKEEPKIRQLMGSQNVSKTIHDILHSSKLINAIEDLLQDKAEFFHSKLMMKSANNGSFTPWHSDWGYWKSIFKKPSLMNCFMAIDSSNIENGCIRYVPGSHRKYIEQQFFPGNAGFNVGLPGDIHEFDSVPVEMEPGDVCFHDAITLHASEANLSNKSRVMNTFAFTSCNNVINEEAFRRQRLI